MSKLKLTTCLIFSLLFIFTSQQTIQTLQATPDILIPIASATATEYQSGTPIQNSIDGSYSTIYHSRWGGLTVFPVNLTYNFNNADLVDYIVVVPRPSGTNGLFGNFQLWITTSNSPSYKYGDFDFQNKSLIRTIEFPGGLYQPLTIQFRVKSGSGGYVSCAEIGFFKLSSPNPTNTVEVALGGNAYLTSGTVGSVVDGGFSNWSSNLTVFSAYMKINTVGNLNLYLKTIMPGESTIQVRFLDKIFNVNLARYKLIQSIGTIQNCPIGYLKVEFQGISRTGSTFAIPSSILLQGASSSGMNYVYDFSFYWGRRGPSVHMSYTQPSFKNSQWFYNQLYVPVGYDPIGSYFMSNGFNEGYFGMQVNSATQRRILFSVWSPFSTNDPSQIPLNMQVKLLNKSSDVTAGVFGGEGSGGQSYWLYNWTAGNTYKFLTRVRPLTTSLDYNSTQYTSYFLAPQFTDWKLIASFERPNTTTYYKGAHSFLENFNTNMGHLIRKVYTRNQWVYTTSKQWIELTKGRFTCDGTGSARVRVDYTGGQENNDFFLQNTGFFNENTLGGTYFNRTANGVPPNIAFVI